MRLYRKDILIMYRTLLFLSICVFGFSQCTDKVEEKRDRPIAEGLSSGNSEKKNYIMEVHDEVMPKMTELRSLEQIIRKQMRQKQMPATYGIAADSLRSADQAMMAWMENYDPSIEGTQSELNAYLDSQKREIEQVRNQINSSINYAKSVMEVEYNR
jgi:hypothetical protein